MAACLSLLPADAFSAASPRKRKQRVTAMILTPIELELKDPSRYIPNRSYTATAVLRLASDLIFSTAWDIIPQSRHCHFRCSVHTLSLSPPTPLVVVNASGRNEAAQLPLTSNCRQGLVMLPPSTIELSRGILCPNLLSCRARYHGEESTATRSATVAKHSSRDD